VSLQAVAAIIRLHGTYYEIRVVESQPIAAMYSPYNAVPPLIVRDA
jgi:hypothetical protein